MWNLHLSLLIADAFQQKTLHNQLSLHQSLFLLYCFESFHVLRGYFAQKVSPNKEEGPKSIPANELARFEPFGNLHPPSDII